MDKRADDLKALLEQVLGLMEIEADVEVSEDAETLRANIEGEDISALIGGHGRTLNAIQCLVNVAINRGEEDWRRVIIDAAGYRERRRESLEKMAAKTADQAVEENREISLEPMNSYERRIVHCALAAREDIATDSRGEEPYRFIVVGPAAITAE